MNLLSGKHGATRLKGIVSPKFQVHAYSVDLTVKNVYSVDPIGQVDFGGNEYQAAGKIAHATYARRPEDSHRWWELDRGCYAVEFNETLRLAEDEIALLEPSDRLLRAGASHATVFLRGHVAPVEMLLLVPTLTMHIKQNARISRLRVFRFDPSGASNLAAGKDTAQKTKAGAKKPRGQR